MLLNLLKFLYKKVIQLLLLSCVIFFHVHFYSHNLLDKARNLNKNMQSQEKKSKKVTIVGGGPVSLNIKIKCKILFI